MLLCLANHGFVSLFQHNYYMAVMYTKRTTVMPSRRLRRWRRYMEALLLVGGIAAAIGLFVWACYQPSSNSAESRTVTDNAASFR